MHLKVSSAKRRPFCLGLNVLTNQMEDTFMTVLVQGVMDFSWNSYSWQVDARPNENIWMINFLWIYT